MTTFTIGIQSRTGMSRAPDASASPKCRAALVVATSMLALACGPNQADEHGHAGTEATLEQAALGLIVPDLHWDPLASEGGHDASIFLDHRYQGTIRTHALSTTVSPFPGHPFAHPYVLNVYLPRGYGLDSSRTYPLIFSVHGCRGNGFDELVGKAPFLFNDTSSWIELVDQRDDIVVATITSEESWNCASGPNAHGPPNPLLVDLDRRAIEESMLTLLARYRIRSDLTFLTGFSGGGRAAHYSGPRNPFTFKTVIGRCAVFDPRDHEGVFWPSVASTAQRYYLLTNPADGAYPANLQALLAYRAHLVPSVLEGSSGSGHDALKEEAMVLVRSLL